MWSALLKSFLFLFTLKSFIVVGNAYPTTDSNIETTSNYDKMTAITDTAAPDLLYECVYIPPNLDFCKFGFKENLWNSLNFPDNLQKLSENTQLKLMESRINKIFFTLYPLMRVPGTKTVQKKTYLQTNIYKLQSCIPKRLPFVYPWCTDKDFSDKNSVVYPITSNKIVSSPKSFYDISKYKIFKNP